MSSVLGVDLSLTGTGLALVCREGPDRLKRAMLYVDQFDYVSTIDGVVIRLHPPKPEPGDSANYSKFRNWQYIRDSVMLFTVFADFVVIEGYAYGASFHREDLAEIGGIIRYALWSENGGLGGPTIVAPTILKKFLTGSGAGGQKELVLKEVYKRYGLDVTDNNMADAYVLAKIGQAMVDGTYGLPAFQREIVEKLQAGPQPKPKKAKKRSA
jgi:hypothetical protein